MKLKDVANILHGNYIHLYHKKVKPENFIVYLSKLGWLYFCNEDFLVLPVLSWNDKRDEEKKLYPKLLESEVLDIHPCPDGSRNLEVIINFKTR